MDGRVTEANYKGMRRWERAGQTDGWVGSRCTDWVNQTGKQLANFCKSGHKWVGRRADGWMDGQEVER